MNSSSYPFIACKTHWLEVIFSHAGECRAVLPANLVIGCGVGKAKSCRIGREGGISKVGGLHTDAVQEGVEVEVVTGWALVVSWDFSGTGSSGSVWGVLPGA